MFCALGFLPMAGIGTSGLPTVVQDSSTASLNLEAEGKVLYAYHQSSPGSGACAGSIPLSSQLQSI